MYGGDSAGATILGPDMHGLDSLDDTSATPEVIFNGLGITSFIVLPHWGSEKYAAKLSSSKNELEKHNDEVIAINDSQAVLVNEDERYVLG